jgi:glycerol-3-phosphate dehydrogenase
MPLYRDGIRRPFVFAVALRVNDFLSRGRNQGVCSDHRIPCGQVIDVDRTRAIFPSVNPQGLKGGAIWYDACMPDSQRVLITVLRWACELGATVLNYVEACQLLKHREEVVGVLAVDRESGEHQEYRANVVVNACGPWCRDVAANFDRDAPTLFKGSLMWNVLLDRETVSDHAVAVTPKKAGGQTYFLVPWNGRLFAGTGHVPWVKGTVVQPMPSTDQLCEFLNDLNLAVPELELSLNDIIRVFPGLLPVTEKGGTKLTVREVVLDHSGHGGPRNLWSISGVKFTTSRLVAEKTLNRIFPDKKIAQTSRQMASQLPHEVKRNYGALALDRFPDYDSVSLADPLRSLIEEESIQHIDDLVFRRTNLWLNPSWTLAIGPEVCKLFNWDESRCSKEIARLKKTITAGCEYPFQ